MKVLLIQAAFRLPDDFKIGNKDRATFNAALAALLAYRRKNKRGMPVPPGDKKEKTLTDLWNGLFAEQWKPGGAKLLAQFALASHVWPPKPAPKKRRTR